MKHGKKYGEAAKLVDRATQYDPAEAIGLVKKTATAKFDETVEVHIRTGCDVMDVMLSSRSVVQLYCPTELVKPLRFWYSLRALSSMRLRQQALTLLAAMS